MGESYIVMSEILLFWLYLLHELTVLAVLFKYLKMFYPVYSLLFSFFLSFSSSSSNFFFFLIFFWLLYFLGGVCMAEVEESRCIEKC